MLVTVGRIGRPHGILGEVTVEVRTDEPDERFEPGNEVLVDSVPRLIESMHWHGNTLLLRFLGINDRDAAEELRNRLIEVERAEDATPDEPDAFYDSALRGCEVRDVAGNDVGVVEDVVHLPGQDLLSVRLRSGREVLVPFVSAIVPTIDMAARVVTIDPPSGLLDSDDE
jgi:16S rRNA processing protein RimM